MTDLITTILKAMDTHLRALCVAVVLLILYLVWDPAFSHYPAVDNAFGLGVAAFSCLVAGLAIEASWDKAKACLVFWTLGPELLNELPDQMINHLYNEGSKGNQNILIQEYFNVFRKLEALDAVARPWIQRPLPPNTVEYWITEKGLKLLEANLRDRRKKSKREGQGGSPKS